MLDQIISIARPAVLDAAAFADLYRQHISAVFNYCLFRVGESAIAEDLTADTFERVWRARHRYRPHRGTFSTWLFAIARRVVVDWQRRRVRRPTTKLDDALPDSNPLPESRIEDSELQARLRRLVCTLGERDQELIALKFGAGLTNRRIAQVMNKSETAIGSAVYRAMQRLRVLWEEANE